MLCKVVEMLHKRGAVSRVIPILKCSTLLNKILLVLTSQCYFCLGGILFLAKVFFQSAFLLVDPIFQTLAFLCCLDLYIVFVVVLGSPQEYRSHL